MNQMKGIYPIFKISIFLIGLNFLLTIIIPEYTIINLFTSEDFKPATTAEYWSVRGQIGNLLAGHFTALAFIGLLITIIQMKDSLSKQDKAIEIQQLELQEQRKELAKTANSLEIQAKIYEKQNFENTYF